MVKKIGVFITIFALVFVGIFQFNKVNVKASTVVTDSYEDYTVTIGSIIYDDITDTGEVFELYFDLPSTNTTTNLLESVIYNYGITIYSVWQPNTNYFYELRKENVGFVEFMPKFDTMVFNSNSDVFYIMLNGEIVKEYEHTTFNGEYITLQVEPFVNSYDEGYQAGLDDGYDLGYADADDDIYNSGYDAGYGYGYDAGYVDARDEFGMEWGDEWLGYNDGFVRGNDTGYNQALDRYAWFNGSEWLGFTEGKIRGYQLALSETDATGFTALLTTIFSGLGGLLAIELLPGIYIGAIIAVPLVFGIIFFIIGKRKGD